MKLSFVIPCYGSEKTLEAVIAEISDVIANRSEWQYEIICVNDQSPDNVLSVIKRLANGNDKIIGVDLTKNMGKHAAVMAGYSFVTGDYIVNIDDDGQCPMDRLWDLVDECINGHDMAMAKYPIRKESAFKRFGSKINSMMSSWLIERPKSVYFTAFSVLKRYVVNEIMRYGNPYPYLEGLILRTTRDIVNVEMEERHRIDGGRGHFTLKKSLSLWVNGFTAFSVKPLRLSAYIGFMVAAIGFISGVYVIMLKLFHPETQMGYSSTMAAMLFLGGLVLFSLGVIGEYIGRIYICVNNSPQYVVREVYRK